MSFFERLTDDMDVVDITESDVAISVVRSWPTILVAASLELVGLGVQQGPRIVDIQVAHMIEFRAIAEADLAEKLFIAMVPLV